MNKSKQIAYYTRSTKFDDDTPIGLIHFLIANDYTACGKKISKHWWVDSTKTALKITCKKCLRILSENIVGY